MGQEDKILHVFLLCWMQIQIYSWHDKIVALWTMELWLSAQDLYKINSSQHYSMDKGGVHEPPPKTRRCWQVTAADSESVSFKDVALGILTLSVWAAHTGLSGCETAAKDMILGGDGRWIW